MKNLKNIKKNLILAKLNNIYLNNDKNGEYTISFFEKSYCGWLYGNGYGLSKETIECFKEWDNLNETEKNNIKYEFMKGK